MPTHIEVIAAERRVLEDDVDQVLAPTPLGQVGILPRHAALLTLLSPGELRLKKGDDEIVLAVGGGFMEVGENRVVILADSAERAEDIDMARVAEAKQRAAARLAARTGDVDVERAQLALARSLAREHALQRYQRRGGRPRTTPSDTALPPELQ